MTDIRSWFGPVNQISYAFATADRMLPFRELLKPGTPFHWDDTLDKIFKESKEVIISEIEEGVRIFDKFKPTCLTGRSMASASGCSRNIANATQTSRSAATQDGR